MTTAIDKHRSLLDKLGIEEVNSGASTGPDAWLADPSGKELVSLDPTTGEPIARILQATPAIYEKVASTAAKAFESWRDVPAPKRGQVIRDLGDRSEERRV